MKIVIEFFINQVLSRGAQRPRPAGRRGGAACAPRPGGGFGAARDPRGKLVRRAAVGPERAVLAVLADLHGQQQLRPAREQGPG